MNKLYYIQVMVDVVWCPVSLPYWSIYFHSPTYIRSVQTDTGTTHVRIWQRPFYIRKSRCYARHCYRTASRINFIQACAWYVILKLLRQPWKKAKIRIHSRNKFWWEK